MIHWLSGVGVTLEALLSGCFSVATDAWMQHPVIRSASFVTRTAASGWSRFWAVLGNPYVGWQYAHRRAVKRQDQREFPCHVRFPTVALLSTDEKKNTFRQAASDRESAVFPDRTPPGRPDCLGAPGS